MGIVSGSLTLNLQHTNEVIASLKQPVCMTQILPQFLAVLVDDVAEAAAQAAHVQ